MRVLEEDVSRFEIPVDDPKGVETLVSFDDLLDHTDGFMLEQLLFGLDILAQVSTVAVVSDDIGLVLVGVDLLDVEEIWPVLDHVENFNFGS